MVNHTQTFHRQFADELFSVFEHFVNLALEGLNMKLLAKQKKQLRRIREDSMLLHL